MQEIGKSQKIVIAMVGLPARGKTYISRKINRYLNWLGFSSRVFNIGNYRRQNCGTDCDQNFFDPKNEQAVKARDECAIQALQDMVKFLSLENGDVGLYDGTNTTKKRRLMIKEMLELQLPGGQILWVESICNDEDIIQKNIKLTKLNNPDYLNKSADEATNDFCGRIEKYKENYEPIDDEENLSYIKIIDIGKNIVIRNIHGFLESKLISYLMNLHIYPRPIYLSRHGESIYNTEDRIGGDSALSAQGELYGKEIAKFFIDEFKQIEGGQEGATLITSTLKRAVQTTENIAHALNIDYLSLKTLDELKVGVCDGLTYTEVSQKFPSDFKERQVNKLTYRYPRGESYLDLISRIEPIIYEIERCRLPVIIIGHQATLRCIYAYFHVNEVTEIPTIHLPLHSVIKLVPETYSCRETRISIDPDNGERISELNYQIKKSKSFIDL